MSEPSENPIPYMPRQATALHRSIMEQIARQQSHKGQPASSRVTNAEDAGGYIARIEKASHVLQAAALRASKFEEEVYELKNQQRETTTQLMHAKDLATGLEKELIAEREKVAHAQTLAFAASKRAKLLEQELERAKANYAGLTASIDQQFNYLFETTTASKAA